MMHRRPERSTARSVAVGGAVLIVLVAPMVALAISAQGLAGR